MTLRAQEAARLWPTARQQVTQALCESRLPGGLPLHRVSAAPLQCYLNSGKARQGKFCYLVATRWPITVGLPREVLGPSVAMLIRWEAGQSEPILVESWPNDQEPSVPAALDGFACKNREERKSLRSIDYPRESFQRVYRCFCFAIFVCGRHDQVLFTPWFYSFSDKMLDKAKEWLWGTRPNLLSSNESKRYVLFEKTE